MANANNTESPLALYNDRVASWRDYLHGRPESLTRQPNGRHSGFLDGNILRCNHSSRIGAAAGRMGTVLFAISVTESWRRLILHLRYSFAYEHHLPRSSSFHPRNTIGWF